MPVLIRCSIHENTAFFHRKYFYDYNRIIQKSYAGHRIFIPSFVCYLCAMYVLRFEIEYFLPQFRKTSD